MTNAYHQAAIGLASYDVARWQDWVPQHSHIVLRPTLNCLLQSCPGKPAGINETDVPPSGTHHVLLFWTKGAPGLNYRTDGRRKRERMKPWSGIHLAPDQPSWWEAKWQSSDGIFHIHLPTSIVDDALAEAAPSIRGASTYGERIVNDQLCQVATMLLRLVSQEPAPNQLLWDSFSVLLAHHLANACLLGEPLVRGGLAPWQTRRCIDYLQDHGSETIGLVDLAALVGLSPFHFARAFKQSVGVPPHRYQLQVRIEKAKALLEMTKMPITEIALDVGYESSQALARLFRREVGLSPSDYRRHHRS